MNFYPAMQLSFLSLISSLVCFQNGPVPVTPVTMEEPVRTTRLASGAPVHMVGEEPPVVRVSTTLITQRISYWSHLLVQ